MIYALDKVAPGMANADTLLYGVEVKFYSARLELDDKLENKIPVFTQERMYLTGVQFQIYFIVGDNAGKPFRYLPHTDKRQGHDLSWLAGRK